MTRERDPHHITGGCGGGYTRSGTSSRFVERSRSSPSTGTRDCAYRVHARAWDACSSTSSSTPAPTRRPTRARELVAAGVDGLFTFEGPHDVFLPLVAAAAAVETDLMTNVAIALPRSPMHLAHAAYDLQLLSRGRFRLGLGSQIRPHIEHRYGATWDRPVARMREIVLAVKAILDVLAGRHPARLPRRVHPAHADAADVRARPQPVRRAAGAARRPRAADDPHRRRGGRRPAGDAVPQPPALPRAHAAGGRRGPRRAAAGASSPIYPQAIVAMGRTADGARPRDPRRAGPAGVLRLHAGVPARCSRSRAGATCSPSSTRCRRPATSPR